MCRDNYSFSDTNSEHSVSASTKGLLKKWKNYQTVNHCSSSKRVVVLVDEGREAKVALLWALSNVLHGYHTLTLLHVLDNRDVGCTGGQFRRGNENGGKDSLDREFSLVKSLETICKSYCPEVQVEVVMTEGNKKSTILWWVKKLEASMLVVGQKKPSRFYRKEDTVDFCIANTECLTVGVRKRSSRIGGYIINSREVKNFWLLA
ncbi:hypothetical protein SUGI_0581890 [Cryptomeria japonica]|nr:hypothetical protein SUGI_0581890 [Cryptomeria japonica]